MAVENMMRIAITPPRIISDEAAMITFVLDRGWDMVHIRHPKDTLQDIRHIIESIPQRLHSKLRIHGHFDLVNEFNIGGLHLNKRCPVPPARYTGPLSRSCHSIKEVINSDNCDYVFLSPVFDSISKSGYKSPFTNAELNRLNQINRPSVIALGGITPANVSELSRYNFHGFAVLGSLMDSHHTIPELHNAIIEFEKIYNRKTPCSNL